MKISELNTNTFLNNDGSPENSYLLINYAATQGAAPTTQKVSLDVLSKAVASKLNLPIAVTDSNSNVTGLQRVRAVGNGYQIENLNASFGSNNSDSETEEITNKIKRFAPIEVSDGINVATAYPLFYIPTTSSGNYVALDSSDYHDGHISILTYTASENKISIHAWEEFSNGAYVLYPSMGGGEGDSGGNGNGNAGC